MSALFSVGFGFVLLALGGALIAWFLYDRLSGKRVRGRICAVQMSMRGNAGALPLNEPEDVPHPFPGEMYRAVYEYTSPEGLPIRATDGSSSNRLRGKIPGKEVWLYVSSRHPERVSRAGWLRLLFGLAFVVSGVLLLRASLAEINLWTIVIGGCMLGPIALKIRSLIKPKEQRETSEQFAARMESAWLNSRELSIEEIRARIDGIRRATVFNARP